MRRPLKLVIYPYVDRWVDYTMEFLGKPVSGSSREYGYETPRGVFAGDEFPKKRLTDSELAAEYHAMDSMCRREQWVEVVRDDDYSDSEREGQAKMYDRLNTLHRFATLPHHDDRSEQVTRQLDRFMAEHRRAVATQKTAITLLPPTFTFSPNLASGGEL